MLNMWNPTMQAMPERDLRRLQLERVQFQLQYAYHSSPFYRRLYDRFHVKVDKIRSLEEFSEKVPIFRKEDLRQYQEESGDPFSGLRCVPFDRLAHIWSSSGTTGLPTMGAYTLNDMRVATEYLCRSYWSAGYRPGMMALTLNINWHWVFVPLFGVCRRLKLKPVIYDFAAAPFAPRVAKWIRVLKPEVMPCVTTEMMSLIPEALRSQGFEPGKILNCFKIITPMGEAITPQNMENARANWAGVTIKQGAGPGESYAWLFEGECAHPGAHVWTDIGYLELVDPDTGEPCGPDERGEMVATNLLVDGLPYIRFGTEDLGWLQGEGCSAGYTHPFGGVVGRAGWRLRVKGKTLIPWDVELILQRHSETALARFCMVKYADQMDVLRLMVAYNERYTRDPQELRCRLQRDIRKNLGVECDIEWVSEDKLPRPVPHKLAKFLDITKEGKGRNG